MLDGTRFAGTVVIDERAGTVEVAGKALPLADCDRIVIVAGVQPVAAPRRSLWLIDGGRLPVTALADGGADAVLVSGPLGELTVPLASVRGWGERELAPADRDQVVVASGLLAGDVQGIVDGKLVFAAEGDPQPLILALSDVLGLRLRGTDRAGKGLALAALVDPARPLLLVARAGSLRLAVAPDVALHVPTGVVLRVEGGRRVYLSALEPANAVEEGAFGVVWKHHRDSNLDGDPIELDGQRYARGISVHSRAVLTWDLAATYLRLRAQIGISDEVGAEGDCEVTITGDGETLWTQALSGRDAGSALDVAVEGVRRLEVRVEYGKRYDIGDRVVLADAQLVRK